MKIGVIGGGAMGEAVIAAMLKGGIAPASDLCVSDIAVRRLAYLHEKYGVATTESNADAAAGAGLVLLMVKPQDFGSAAGTAQVGVGSTTIASILAGVTIASLTKALGTNAVIRFMSNTPAQIGQGMTAWTATPAVPAPARQQAQAIFAALGKEVEVADEKYLDMVTALSGSGPGYVFLFIEALIDAGVHVGLSRDLATTMALQTVAGSARYMEETQRHPAELRGQVTSPGGTTAEGLRALERGGLRSAVLDAVVAAYEKSKALGGS